MYSRTECGILTPNAFGLLIGLIRTKDTYKGMYNLFVDLSI